MNTLQNTNDSQDGRLFPFQDLDIKTSYQNQSLRVELEALGDRYIGKEAIIELKYGVLVKDSKPQNSSVSLESQSILLSSMNVLEFFVGGGEPLYFGKGIDVTYFLSISIIDAYLAYDTLFDYPLNPTEWNQDFAVFQIEDTSESTSPDIDHQTTSRQSRLDGVTKLLQLPQEEDSVNHFQALKLLPRMKQIILGMCLVVALSGLGIVFIHLFAGIIVTCVGVVVGIVFWYFSGNDYYKFQFLVHQIEDGMQFSDLFQAVSLVALKNTTVEVSLANSERGGYFRGVGSGETSHTFDVTLFKVLLASKTYPLLHPGDIMGKDFLGSLDFSQAFPQLMPMIPSRKTRLLKSILPTHGLEVSLVVKIIHPDLPDREFKQSINFSYSDYCKLVEKQTEQE